MKILCVFGKYQYGNPSRGIGTEYAAFIPALRNLGHEVIHFESWNRSFYKDYAELNNALLRTVNNEVPDIMLTVQLNYEIWLETLQIIRARKDVATICWTTDDSWKYREVSRFIGKAYHAMTTTYPEVLPKYQLDGISNVLLTQWAANSEFFREPISAKDCRYGVSFVGSVNDNRKRRVAELRNHGVDVSCFGHGWPAGSVPSEAIPEIMQSSIISLNFANSKGQNQIKARTFEAPGAGGFLLTENAPGLQQYFHPGKEIDVYNNFNEMVNKIKYYLDNPEQRDAIARAGFERTIKEHSYEIRMNELLNFALSVRDKWASNNNKVELSFDKVLKTHHLTLPLKLLRNILILPCILIWGRQRGPRAARRLMFELSWRFTGYRTFTAAGLPGRMFPEQ